MGKDRMDAGRGRSGQQVKKPGQGAKGAPGGQGGKKVQVRSTDRKPFYLLLGAIALAAVRLFCHWTEQVMTEAAGQSSAAAPVLGTANARPVGTYRVILNLSATVHVL